MSKDATTGEHPIYSPNSMVFAAFSMLLLLRRQTVRTLKDISTCVALTSLALSNPPN
jgi:hypothetical protein